MMKTGGAPLPGLVFSVQRHPYNIGMRRPSFQINSQKKGDVFAEKLPLIQAQRLRMQQHFSPCPFSPRGDGCSKTLVLGHHRLAVVCRKFKIVARACFFTLKKKKKKKKREEAGIFSVFKKMLRSNYKCMRRKKDHFPASEDGPLQSPP